MLFVFLTEGKLLDLRLLLMSKNLTEVAEIWLGPKTPFQRKPTRWNRVKVLKEVSLLTVVVIFTRDGRCVDRCSNADRRLRVEDPESLEPLAGYPPTDHCSVCHRLGW